MVAQLYHRPALGGNDLTAEPLLCACLLLIRRAIDLVRDAPQSVFIVYAQIGQERLGHCIIIGRLSVEVM